MPATTELIAASVPENHPSGTRRRAGFEFTFEPSIAEVTAEERAAIKADPYIIIHRRLSQAWFKAMGIERTAKNEEKYAKENPEDWMETANLARITGSVAPTTRQAKKTVVTGKDAPLTNLSNKNEKAQDIKITSSKEDIVKALVELKLEAGKDFDPDANRNALFAIYREKAAAQTSTNA